MQLLTQALKFLWLSRSETFELRASSLLLSTRFRTAFLVRCGLLIGAGLFAPLTHPAAAFILALAGEWLGRWLFFVTVVPKNMAAGFQAQSKAAV